MVQEIISLCDWAWIWEEKCWSLHILLKDSSRFISLHYISMAYLFSNSQQVVQNMKTKLSKEIDMKDLGALHYFLSIEVKRDHIKRMLSISQRKYVVDVLKKFRRETCKPVSTPFAVGAILSMKQCTKIIAETKMINVPYANIISKLMYPNIRWS